MELDTKETSSIEETNVLALSTTSLSSSSSCDDSEQPILCHAKQQFPEGWVIFMLAVMQIMGFTFLFLVGFVEQVVTTLIWGLLALLLYIYIRWASYRGWDNCFTSGAARGLFFGALALAILFYYEGTHGTVHELKTRDPNKKLYDNELLNMDRFFLGWLFPDGQLSLWADENEFIGPNSVMGPYITEILQIYYASFFGWCSVLIVYVGLWEHFICGFTFVRTESLQTDSGGCIEMHSISPEEESNEKDISDPTWNESSGKIAIYRYRFWKWTFWFTHDAAIWKRLMMITLAILGAFLLNYMVSFAFPAVSPRISLEHRFRYPLTGSFFSEIIRGTLTKTDEGTYGSFPSGHVALTWVPAIAALKLGYPKYGWSCLVAAVLITFSTLYLRYHYFTDVLFAIPLIIFGLYFGGIYSCAPYRRASRRAYRWLQSQWCPTPQMQEWGSSDRGLTEENVVLEVENYDTIGSDDDVFEEESCQLDDDLSSERTPHRTSFENRPKGNANFQ